MVAFQCCWWILELRFQERWGSDFCLALKAKSIEDKPLLNEGRGERGGGLTQVRVWSVCVRITVKKARAGSLPGGVCACK